MESKKEIFIRNLGFTTPEEKLRELFEQYVPKDDIEFCLIVKDKETGNSKGTAFLKLKSPASYDKIMSMYYDYSNNKSAEMNPFEIDGRNLKLFEAVSRDKVKELQKDKKQDLRNKEFLYYGLSNESIANCELIDDITNIDKEKRERLIEIKKNNYYKNPNYHVSSTRISIRNFEKKITEDDIRKVLNDSINEEMEKKYKNKRIFVQVKLIKEGEDEKSKCVAFVECCDFEIAKYIIDKLSGYKFNEKSKKGLIIDFALDDFRKRAQREKRMEKIKEQKKEKYKQIKELRKEQNEPKIDIVNCNDIQKLIEYYHLTFSRGKKQRIKKKLKKLGYTKPIPPMQKKPEEKTEDSKNQEGDKKNQKKENYVSIKISNNKTDLNKKYKEKKNSNENLLKKKRGRNEANNNNKNYFNVDEDEVKTKKRKVKEAKKERMIKKKMTQKEEEENYDEEEQDDDLNMNEYYNKIMKNLKKKK